MFGGCSPVMARVHAVSGLGAGLATGLLSGNVAVALLCGGVGLTTSYIPDLDHPKATAVRALGPLGWLLCRGIRAMSRTFGLPAHRGISHTVVFAVSIGALVATATAVWVGQHHWIMGLAAASGVLAALAGDWVTKSSLPHLWWPFVSRTGGPPRWLRITTGKRVEKLLIFPVLAAGCVALATYALTL